jgi:hypothetical protein
MGEMGWRPEEVETEIFNARMCSMRFSPWEGWDGGLRRSKQRYLIKNVLHEVQPMGGKGWRPVEVGTEIFNARMCSMRFSPWEGWDGGLRRSKQRYLIKNVLHEVQPMGGKGWRPVEVGTEIFNARMCSMRSSPWEGWDGGHQADLRRSEQRYLIKVYVP